MRFNKILQGVAFGGLGLVLTGCGGASGAANDFPSESIEIVVGFDAGGSTDVNVRALANEARETCGTSILVSNQPGASGAIALEAIANSTPDGYTLGTTPTEISALSHMGLSEITYEDFQAIMLYIIDPHGFYVPSDSQFDDMDEVVAAAEGGETIRVATSGPASPYAVTFQEVADTAGVAGQLVNVPYTGLAEAIPAAVRGEVDLLVSDVSQVTGQVDAGDLVPLAIAAEERVAHLPDTQTLAELGIPVEGGSIYGLAAPEGVEPEIVEQLNECFTQAYETEAFQEFLESQNSNPFYLDQDDFTVYLEEEYERYGSLLDDINLED